ncbi:MAG TPA: alpha/beta hydrolase [Candidatus Hydrogenedentes bacterium]|nr:alpha/beta hydrolase [Candidatus Hydrogenedentota bacterium]
MEVRASTVDGYGGVRLNLWDYGGDGIPILLVHCTGGCGRLWDPVAKRLRRSHRVYALDTRGHGDSDKPKERAAYAWQLSGWDLLSVVEGLGYGSALIPVGHSGGGAHIAYAEWLRPGTFSRSVLIDAIVGPRAFFSGESVLARTARRRAKVFHGRDAALARFTTKTPMNAWTRETVEAYVMHGLEECGENRVALKCPPAVEAWMYEMGGACEVFEQVHELKMQVLLITGAHSDVKPLVLEQYQRLPRALMYEMAATGHFIPQERPDELSELLCSWV